MTVPYEALAPISSQEHLSPEAAIAEVLQQHEARLHSLIQGHEQLLIARPEDAQTPEAESVPLNHYYEELLDRATPDTAPQIFEDMKTTVAARLDWTRRGVSRELHDTAKELVGLLPPQDAALLHGPIANLTARYGRGDPEVERQLEGLLAQATSPEAQSALRTILDRDAAKALTRTVKRHGLTGAIATQYIHGALSLFSSEFVQQAAVATLDAGILAHVSQQMDESPFFGATYQLVAEDIEHTPSPAVKLAMYSSLDARVFTEFKRDAKMFGANQFFAQRILALGSTTKARTVMHRAVTGSTSPDNSLTIEKQFADDIAKGYVEADDLGSLRDEIVARQKSGEGNRKIYRALARRLHTDTVPEGSPEYMKRQAMFKALTILMPDKGAPQSS